MRSWRFLLGILISGVFLVYAFRGQDYGAIWDSLKGVRYWLLIPALGLYFCGVLARTFRWSLLLSPIEKISVRNLLPITVIGFMANNVLPLRTGEVVRSYVLNKNYGVRKAASLTTIAVERIFDGITMVGFILIAAITIDLTNELQHVVKLASVLFGIAVSGLIIATFANSLRHWSNVTPLMAAGARLPAGGVTPISATQFCSARRAASGLPASLLIGC